MGFLELKNINKSFRKIEVLKDINITIEKKSISSIFGYSGAGKTTLLSIICGIEKQDRGDVILEGKNISKVDSCERSIALITDKPLLFPHMNVFENIAFGLKMGKKHKRVKIDVNLKDYVNDIMQFIGISGLENRYPHQLSMGQAQRVSLARAIATNPKIILMDEPFTNLDVISKNKVRSFIRKVQEQLSITILMVTHDINDVVALSSKMFIIHKGTIQENGDPKTLIKKPISKESAYLVGSENILEGTIKSISRKTNTAIIIDVDKNISLEVAYRDGFLENENVYLTIRPDDIMILREDKLHNHAKENHFKCEITSTVFTAIVVELVVRCCKGLELKIFLPYHVYQKMNLDKNNALEISLKKDSIHMMKKKNIANAFYTL